MAIRLDYWRRDSFRPRGRGRLAEVLREGALRPYFQKDGCHTGLNNTVAKDVEPERISLPRVAGVVRPVDVVSRGLRPERVAVLRDLSQLELPVEEWPLQTLRPCHRIDRDAERAFARELIDRDMALLVPEDDIPVGPDGRRLVGGWFAVDHTRGRLRLIFDRRPQNSTERTLTWPRLPSGCQLQHVVLEPWETIRGSGDGLECWFYNIRHEPDWYIKRTL
jgi:hypothetical protein